jgi:hypothetical protein
MPVNNLAHKWQAAFPKLHHFREIRKAISNSQTLTLIGTQALTVDSEFKNRAGLVVSRTAANLTIASAPRANTDTDLLHLHAAHAHKQMRALLAQAGIKMQHFARLRLPRIVWRFSPLRIFGTNCFLKL